MVIRGKVSINGGWHGVEADVVGILDAAGGFIPILDYHPLGGEVGVGDRGETLGRDDSVCMYEGLEIRHTLYLPLPLSTIIVSRFSSVNKNKDNNI